MTEQSYGEVHGPRIGEMSRRRFMRRMLGAGIGLLSLEFLGGTAAFLWPNVRGGLGGKLEVGAAADIVTRQAEWANGLPYIYQQKIFFINVPAIQELVKGNTAANIPDPGTTLPNPGDFADVHTASVLALYRKCPHLGCQIPQLCDSSHWFECLCHGSKYTVLGEKRAGPAPRGMDRFTTTFENGSYFVDTSSIITGPPIGTDTFDSRKYEDMQHCSA
jgi:cytochrome b6-f complex iron-sulfur subunit